MPVLGLIHISIDFTLDPACQAHGREHTGITVPKDNNLERFVVDP